MKRQRMKFGARSEALMRGDKVGPLLPAVMMIVWWPEFWAGLRGIVHYLWSIV